MHCPPPPRHYDAWKYILYIYMLKLLFAKRLRSPYVSGLVIHAAPERASCVLNFGSRSDGRSKRVDIRYVEDTLSRLILW